MRRLVCWISILTSSTQTSASAGLRADCRPGLFACLGGILLLGMSGCAHGLEDRTISAFVKSLEEADIEQIKQHSSAEFKESALRHKQSADALKLLNLPAGEVEILEVQQESDDQRKVLAAIGPRKKKMIYTLVRDPESGQWVVDDVMAKVRLKPGQVNKPISEQMDLLLSIHEILDAWKTNDRNQILGQATPELSASLQTLPEKALVTLAKTVTADLRTGNLKPQVEGHNKSALVRIPRRAGQLAMTLKYDDQRWLVDDLAVQSPRDTEVISSVRKQATVMRTAIDFYQAYRSGNKARLEQVTNSRFYRLNLANADLGRVPLPAVPLPEGEADIRLLLTRAEVIAKAGDEVLQISLSQGAPQLVDDDSNLVETVSENNKPFLVEEVTIHEPKTRQEKRLSALYSSQAIVSIFAEAMANRNLTSVRLSSSADFNSRVWQRVEFERFAELPLDSLKPARPEIIDTEFKGPLTEVTVSQGDTPLTYVLREQGGALLVDDILRPALDQPTSLKSTLEVLLPFDEFRRGLATGDVKLLRKSASRDFNKMVFHQLETTPRLPQDPSRFLQGRITRVQVTPDRAVLTIGNERFGAKAHLSREGDFFVVDDIVLVSGLEQSQRFGLKQMLRERVIDGTSISTAPKLESLNEEDELQQELFSR